VNLYTDIARGNFAAVEHLVQAAQKSQGKTRSIKAKRQRGADGASVSRQTVEGEEEDSSSSSGEEDDDEEEQEPMLVAPKPKPEKMVDEDGFELVQKGRRKR
jgi:pre-rRNA-processing protein TSR2